MKEEGGREVRRENRKNKLTTMMDDKEIGEGLFEAENGNLKKKKEEKKTKQFVGKELSTEEKDLATLGPNATFTTQGF